MIRVSRWSDLAAFIEDHRTAWLANEGEDIALARLSPEGAPAGSLGLRVDDGAQPLTAALVAGDQLLVSRGSASAVEALGRALVEQGSAVPGIFGHEDTAAALARWLSAHSDLRYRLVKRLDHMALAQAPTRSGSAGRLRTAKTIDLETLAEHRAAAQAESNTQRPFDARASAQRDLDAGVAFVWEDPTGGVVGSAASYRDRSPSSAYIDHVFVPGPERRRGVATALVAELCRRAQDEGRTPRLAVDVENAPARDAYLRLGFEPVARVANFRAVAPDADGRGRTAGTTSGP